MNKFIFVIFISLTSISAFAMDSIKKDRFVIPFKNGIELLRQLEQSEKKKTTTSERKETKSVIPDSILQGILEGFKSANSPVHWISRDINEDEGSLNGTLTYYGKSAFFLNHGGIWTKFRLRIRMYLNVDPVHHTVQRSKANSDFVYLEIKVKGPTAAQPNASLKYRMKLHDESVLILFRSDPKSERFSATLEELRKDAISLGESPNKVDAILKAIQTLSQWKEDKTRKWVGTDFIKPELITNYVRQSFAFTEKNYPLKKENNKIVHEDVQYQLTIDHDVRGIKPVILAEDKKLEYQRYFESDFSGAQVHYPEEATVVEFKESKEVADSIFSSTRGMIQKALIDQMEAHQLPQFEKNHGKAGALTKIFHRRLLDEKR